MLGKKIILTSIIGMVLLACSGKAVGGTLSLRLSTNLGHRISRPLMPRANRHDGHGEQVFVRPHGRRFMRIQPRRQGTVVVGRPRRQGTVVVGRPRTRPIATNLVPTVTIPTPEIVVKPRVDHLLPKLPDISKILRKLPRIPLP